MEVDRIINTIQNNDEQMIYRLGGKFYIFCFSQHFFFLVQRNLQMVY